MRSDGVLRVGQEAEFPAILLNKAFDGKLPQKWLAAVKSAKDAEIQWLVENGVAVAKRKWEAASLPERCAEAIRTDILPCKCPKCLERFFYDGGCLR